jgi:hypothetical protein
MVMGISSSLKRTYWGSGSMVSRYIFEASAQQYLASVSESTEFQWILVVTILAECVAVSPL